MRYTEKLSVFQVLEWLANKGISSKRDSYQNFMRRVVKQMSDDCAKSLNVDLPLLHAVRQRFDFPISPRPGCPVPTKTIPNFDSRSRRRRVRGVKKVSPRPVVPPVRPAGRVPLEAGQAPLPGTVAKPPAISQMRGTPDAPQGLGDWKIINAAARRKLYATDRKIMPNYQGEVIHLKHRKSYTEEELVTLFQLTSAEAQSCFLSL